MLPCQALSPESPQVRRRMRRGVRAVASLARVLTPGRRKETSSPSRPAKPPAWQREAAGDASRPDSESPVKQSEFAPRPIDLPQSSPKGSVDRKPSFAQATFAACGKVGRTFDYNPAPPAVHHKHQGGAGTVQRQREAADIDALEEFREHIVTRYGGHKQLILRMQQAMSIGNERKLTADQFEYMVVKVMKYGDKAKARQLFSELNIRGSGKAHLDDLSPLEEQDPMSLVDLRLMLLNRFSSLTDAFRVLEHAMVATPPPYHRTKSGDANFMKRNSQRNPKLHREAFCKILHTAFRLPEKHADHFFQLMDTDGSGDVSLSEFSRCLTDLDDTVILADLRARLLAKTGTVESAFQLMDKDRSNSLTATEFSAAIAKVGVSIEEAQVVFQKIDADRSGTVTLQELRNGLRLVAPMVSAEEIWQRLCILAGSSAPKDVFRMIDRGGKGKFSEADFDHAVCELDISPANAAGMFKSVFLELSLHGSELISFADFSRAVEPFLPATEAEKTRSKLLINYGSERMAVLELHKACSQIVKDNRDDIAEADRTYTAQQLKKAFDKTHVSVTDADVIALMSCARGHRDAPTKVSFGEICSVLGFRVGSAPQRRKAVARRAVAACFAPIQSSIDRVKSELRAKPKVNGMLTSRGIQLPDISTSSSPAVSRGGRR
mmetsp:Transcript_20485/g.51984  ORF Transcript_20485/g.51984 Transcript_20485/m.51984 type:complete len:664 (+) Transcript_20485:170-2161(+)